MTHSPQMLKNLAIYSRAAGAPVDISWRGTRQFTLSFASPNRAAARRLVEFVQRDPLATVTTKTTREASHVYIDIAPTPKQCKRTASA